MKKIIMIIAAAFMVLACGGNKSQDPYTKYMDQAYEAMEKGDYDLAEDLLNEYGKWIMTLDDAESEVAAAKFEAWYETYGEKFEDMYEDYLVDTYGDVLDEFDADDVLGIYEEALERYGDVLDAYGDELVDAIDEYEDELVNAMNAYEDELEEAMEAYGDELEEAMEAYEDELLDALEDLDW